MGLATDVLDFYDRHPISEAQVRAALARRRGVTDAVITAEDLFEFDQDHYGGLAAVDTLARLAGVSATTRVLDTESGYPRLGMAGRLAKALHVNYQTI